MIANFRDQPDGALSIERYRRLAGGYDASCRFIGGARSAAIGALRVREDATVFDVACGTGMTTYALAGLVGAAGHVLGIEQSPSMLDIARARFADSPMRDRVTLIESAAERAQPPCLADRVLFCYTHDVLQSPAALSNLFGYVKPGARVVVLGIRLQPWWWAAPVNLWVCARGWPYLTTFKGLHRPWQGLLRYCPDMGVVDSFHLGSSYLAVGHATAVTSPS